jgi:hypothetical protein
MIPGQYVSGQIVEQRKIRAPKFLANPGCTTLHASMRKTIWTLCNVDHAQPK